ncbi:MAG: Ig-like domain-containing protein [Gemmatimonadetes bacterium]|nr:Ig-like domain-containing protein [Gemmatimonadota bacterium]
MRPIGSIVSWNRGSPGSPLDRILGGFRPRAPGCGLAIFALALGSGCGDPAPVATTIRISPDDVVLEDVLKTADLTATVLDENGVAMTDIPVDWTSSDSAIAAVSESGRVTGRAAGTTTVRASVEGVTGEATIVVKLGEVGVLHVVHEEMGGDGWEDDYNWKTEAPLYTWHGVRTEDSMPAQKVTRLWLYDNGLTGGLPPEVGTVQTLRFLGLFRNRITGAIPPELGQLTDLITLSLSENQLTGSIPSELESLQSLRFLVLDNNELTGSIPPELGKLWNLERLDLAMNALSGSIPPELGKLRNLRTLDLAMNALTGSIPRELGNLESMMLDLSNNRLTGPIPPELGNIRPLWYLHLNGNELVGPIPPELGNFWTLQDLVLRDNQLTGAIPRELGRLKRQLRHLDLANNRLTGTIRPNWAIRCG